jgi:putative ABC transport system substrate-binding protein
VNVSKDIPVVFGAITDPVGAKLADSLERPGGNKTGTTNRWPFEEQVRLISRVVPGAKRIGVVVNPGEENCNAGMKVIRHVAGQLGLEIVEVPVANSAEVKAATESLVRKTDVLLISPSNTVFSALDTLIGTARDARIPVIGGDESAVKKGSLATYGFRNADVGIATAEIVLKLCRDNTPAGDIPVALPPKARLFLNEDAAAALGIKLDKSLVKEASSSQ